jgi:Galactose-1-phosphate uridylyltransferase
MDGLGRHEIIIETEEHVKCISDLSQVQVEKVILAYRDRYVEIASDKNIKHILIFKNYWRRCRSIIGTRSFSTDSNSSCTK